MDLQPVKAEILAAKMIPNVDAGLAESLALKPHQRSIGILTTNIDDVGYTALDAATKKADVEVVYGSSFYAGAAHASGPLSGEFIGILAGPTPAEVKSGMEVFCYTAENEAWFYALDPEAKHTFYAHVISRTGSYLSEVAGIREGEPLAYLIAPPLEAVMGLDAALKAADVRLVKFYKPPSETNFGGGLLTGSQSSCKSATQAFMDTVIRIAENPKVY
ncbi:ethanolamine utilization protein EutL [Melghirimyces profundicolus]|uniref:Ethanolamine utilization protein EutL n=1 Tax=Melghirimyces profundicolus TaxID=1242148 RepID=A0A2T6C8Q0_9BACL|nr:ethanolamine utilization microcompartment protein EutL [Melghirimyces profundicolus]PTX64646.1 ethanolamine utilization protein EutL [Melghirimyces profundicolus]